MLVSVLTGGSPPPEPEICGGETREMKSSFYCCIIYFQLNVALSEERLSVFLCKSSFKASHMLLTEQTAGSEC